MLALVAVAVSSLAARPAGRALSVQAASEGVSWAPALLRLALATAAVLALAWGALWFLRALSSGKRSGIGRDWISVLATSYVAPKRQISIVRVLDRYLVVGVTEGAIHTLAELDADSVQKSLEQGERLDSDRSPFAHFLRGALTAPGDSWRRAFR